AAGADNLACLIYTSGSTGRPKGVLLAHRALTSLVASFLDSYLPSPADRMLPATAIAYASFAGELFPLLAAGGALVLPEESELLDPAALVGLIRRAEVSIASTVPSVVAGLNALPELPPRLRLLLVGGEALAAGDIDRLLGAGGGSVEVVNGYGLTEAGICSTVHVLAAADVAAGRKPPIGRPIANHAVHVLDPALRLTPFGVPGELYVGGGGLARGYLNDPALTAERFVPSPFAAGGRLYRTGDRAAWGSDGALHYLGRLDQQVKVRGFRIEPEEVESALALHPRVREAAVVLRRDRGVPPRLVAYVVAAEPPPAADELLGFLRERLPEPMVPAAALFLDALPLGPSGKVDPRRLPPPPAARPELSAAFTAPRSELERRIAAVWQEALGLPGVGIHDNFFDLGGHSLLLAKVHAGVQAALGRELPLVELFRHPTVAALARALAAAEGGEPAAAPVRAAAPRPRRDASGEIAIVGMAGRFPGAKSVAQLWRNLVAERESITFFDDEELRAAGVAPALLADPAYVKAKGILGDVELFDAGFFGLNPREAELMDPQHRLFLECCWEALEAAGYDPERTPGRIGVYGGLSMNTYLLMNLLPHLELVASADTLEASLGNDKDPLTARVAYKLNLRGPSVTVQTASSTSLAAVHLAAKAVLQGDCEMALAGGVSIHLPERSGYLYQEGGTVARDGHCRAFDAAATGFVSGHGAGVVVLKGLEDAVADGDHIHAVLKGTACNNDGSLKVSFMAPSVEGQVDVYRRAYEDAGIGPESVGYVECHGTGTALGDPIEIAALAQVFTAATPRRQFCAIGSLKTNIGHLDTAAGVCGLIKAALALEHRTLPASLHFETPNPQIDFAASPFFVNAATRPWESDGAPRRAGVTSLGMGGTNVHVVLEEPPPAPPAAAPARPLQLLPLTAKSATALDALSLRLADHLHDHPALPLADVAWTLQAGRRPFAYRRVLLARDTADAGATLAVLDPERVLSGVATPGERPVAFLLPGQGAQYPGMGRGVYDAEPAFRAELDRCAELLAPHLGSDLRELLFPADASPEAALRLEQTAIAQPALFAVAWATARLWMSWGVRPAALLGHSLGELVAACLAGVMSLEDALALVALRGRLMQQMPRGAMLAVPLGEAELAPLLGADLALAAVNGPAACVVSGPVAAIDAFEDSVRDRAQRGVLQDAAHQTRRLRTSHAFHSSMMEAAVRPFVERVAACRLTPPAVPFLSNVTGTWIRAEEATDPEYWGRQIRATVRFADGLASLLAEPGRVLLEVGPGNTLATLARRHPARRAEQAVLSSLRHVKEAVGDQAYLLTALARLWLAGVEVNWEAFAAPERRRRVPLPTYPFERQRYWVEPERAGARRAAAARREPSDWFYAPGWRQAPLPALAEPSPAGPSSWLLLRDGAPLGGLLAARLEAAGQRVATAVAGADFRRLGPGVWQVRPGHEEDFGVLLAAVQPRRILHLWALGAAGSDQALLERCFDAPRALARALARRGGEDEVVLGVVADGLAQVTGGERLEPLKATLLGPCLVAPREERRLACRVFDVDLTDADPETLADQVLHEASAAGGEPLVAYRRHLRWVPSFAPVHLAAPEGPPPRLRAGGVYLVTGGLGGLGLAVAGHLSRTLRAKLVLVGRSALPPREAWGDWLAGHGEEEITSRRLRRLLALEEAGAELLVLAADVADREAMRAVRGAAEERFGRVHGVVHAAGVAGGALLRAEDRRAAAHVLAPKVEGTRVLEEVFAGAGLELLVLFSSITAVLPQLGQSTYVAANAFLDATAARNAGNGGAHTVAIGWDAWREVGMAVATEVPRELEAWRRASLAQGLTTAEGLDAFDRVLASGLTQVVVSTQDLEWRLAQNAREAVAAAALEVEAPAAATYPRTLATPFVPPASDFERAIAEIWQEMLGVEQVGRHDNFFDLGGNSLAGLRVTRRLKDRLGADVSEVSLYEAPTVAALARLLAPAGAEEEAAEAAQGRSRGERRRARLERRRSGEAE
ncbi:MAG TPA: beta-ketoacyl synthase N-terminal-like domain-containing protein, partial [Thermoanaerobaculia bacterium]